jgi:hypothetical protein
VGTEPRILTPAHATWLAALTKSDNAALDPLQELERPPSDLATIGTVVTGATSRRDDARMRK